MDTNRFIKQPEAPNGKLRLLSLYGDLPASVRARWAAAMIARLAGPRWQTTSEMWKIDSLKVGAPIREMITNDAADADVIIVAASSLTQSEPALIQWINSWEACKNNHLFPGLIVGLLGDEETTKVDLNCVVKPLIHVAQLADRDFIWHLMENGAMNDSSWLADSVQDLLARKLWFEVFGKALQRLTTAGGVNADAPSPAPGQNHVQATETKHRLVRDDDVAFQRNGETTHPGTQTPPQLSLARPFLA